MKFCETHLRAYPDEHTGCTLCYCNRKKESKPPKEKKVYEIPKVSAKKQEREKEMAKVRSPKKKAAKTCQSCTNPEGPLDYSHILSVRQYPELEAHPLNGIVECRKCHTIWEDGTYEEKTSQKSWPLKKAVILMLKPEHLHKMQLKQAS